MLFNMFKEMENGGRLQAIFDASQAHRQSFVRNENFKSLDVYDQVVTCQKQNLIHPDSFYPCLLICNWISTKAKVL